MKYFAIVFTILSTSFLAHSQTYEIGGMIGGANYIGDIGKTNYINPNSFAIGGIFKWNRSARHSFRGSILIAKIKGDDAESSNSRRKERGYSFENTISEISAGIEYTFWDFNVHSQKAIATPYLYTGLTYFSYHKLSKEDTRNNITKDGNAGSFAIPMVIGFKANMGQNAMVGFEIGARYTFTDNLDGSNPKNEEEFESLNFGNTNSDDWYVFTGVTVTFAFGRRPCYCNF